MEREHSMKSFQAYQEKMSNESKPENKKDNTNKPITDTHGGYLKQILK